MTSGHSPKHRAGWLNLVAATSLGLGALVLQAEVASDDVPDDVDGEFRLIVHSYPEGSVEGGALGHGARPLGSYQRSVTAEELRKGVPVRLVQLADDTTADAGDIVAWVEPGAPNLEFDARTARPGQGAAVGWASAKDDAPRVVLRRSS